MAVLVVCNVVINSICMSAGVGINCPDGFFAVVGLICSDAGVSNFCRCRHYVTVEGLHFKDAGVCIFCRGRHYLLWKTSFAQKPM